MTRTKDEKKISDNEASSIKKYKSQGSNDEAFKIKILLRKVDNKLLF